MQNRLQIFNDHTSGQAPHFSCIAGTNLTTCGSAFNGDFLI